MSADTTLPYQIMKLFEEKMELEVSSMEDDLLNMGILDSLGLMNLLVHIENEFGLQISIDDLELDNFRTIATIAEFVRQKSATC